VEFSKIRSWKPERGGLRQPVQPYTYDRLLVFDKTSAQPYFAVITCSDAVMSMFYSIVLTRSLIFCSYELLCHKRWVYFPPISNLERWWFTFNAMTHKIRIVGVEEYAYYLNKLLPKYYVFGAHTKYKWPPYATEWKSSPWKFSAYATVLMKTKSSGVGAGAMFMERRAPKPDGSRDPITGFWGLETPSLVFNALIKILS